MFKLFERIKQWWHNRYNSTFDLFYDDDKFVRLELRKGKLYISYVRYALSMV